MRKPATAFEKEVAIAASGRRKRSSFLMDEPVGQAKEFPSLNRKKDAFLFFCGTLSVLAGTSGALCALAFGMALVEVRLNKIKNRASHICDAFGTQLMSPLNAGK